MLELRETKHGSAFYCRRAGHEELTEMRRNLNSRYDDLKSGRVMPVSGDEMKERLRKRSAARRTGHR